MAFFQELANHLRVGKRQVKKVVTEWGGGGGGNERGVGEERVGRALPG